MNEVLKFDQNSIRVLGGITNDVDQDIQMLRVDPITKRLLIAADFSGVAVTSINGLTGDVTIAAGSNITLTPTGNMITISSSASGSGDVSATTTLTSNAIVLGAGTTNVKTVTGLTTDGTSKINLGVAGTSAGKIDISGATSGTVTIQTAAAAGTWTLTLPTTDGNASQFLQTDGNGVTTWASGGTGDVVGPSSATDNAIVRFDGTTGKLIQNSLITIDDVGVANGFVAVTSGTFVCNTHFRLDKANNTSTGANASVGAFNDPIIRFTGALTSIDMANAGFAGQWTILYNDTGGTVTINHDTGATAANRFYCPGGVGFALVNRSAVSIFYSSDSSRWIVISN